MSDRYQTYTSIAYHVAATSEADTVRAIKKEDTSDLSTDYSRIGYRHDFKTTRTGEILLHRINDLNQSRVSERVGTMVWNVDETH